MFASDGRANGLHASRNSTRRKLTVSSAASRGPPRFTMLLYAAASVEAFTPQTSAKFARDKPAVRTFSSILASVTEAISFLAQQQPKTKQKSRAEARSPFQNFVRGTRQFHSRQAVFEAGVSWG